MARRRQQELVYIGVKNSVLALDRATGVEVWRTKLPKVRFKVSDFVGLAQDGDALFATFSGEVFCLDAATGAVRWHNSLPKLGVGVVSVLPAASSTARVPEASPPPSVAQILAARRQSAS
jgi:glucose dehydrogenase